MEQLDESLTDKELSSTKDEGYCSRTGDSFFEEADNKLSYNQSKKNLSEELSLKNNANSEETANIEFQLNEHKDLLLTEPLKKIKKWDCVSRTVERFSHNTITLLSWIDEMDEVSTNRTRASPFYESPDGRKTSVMEHVAKLLNQVRHDADALFRDIPSEAQTILTVLEKLENRCKELGIQVDKTWYKDPMDSASRVNMNNTSNELKPSSDSSDVNKSTPTENRDNRVSFNSTLDSGVGEPNCLSSTSNSFNKSMTTFDIDSISPNNRRNLSLKMNWIKFTCEYKAICDWLEKMEKLIRTAEKSKISKADLMQLFKNYLHHFVTSKSKRDLLNIKANYIQTMFPEAREVTEMRMTEIERWWNGLMLRLSNHLKPLLSEDDLKKMSTDELKQSTQHISSHGSKTSKPKEAEFLTDNKEKSETIETSTPNPSYKKDDVDFESLPIGEQVRICTDWLKEVEGGAYKKENSVAIGWNPNRLKQLLKQNKEQQEDLIEAQNNMNHLLKKTKKRESSEIEDTSLMWSTLMLQQRYFNLNLFLIDMECILERRLEVLEKDFDDKQESLPTDGVWTDQGMDMNQPIRIMESGEAA